MVRSAHESAQKWIGQLVASMEAPIYGWYTLKRCQFAASSNARNLTRVGPIFTTHRYHARYDERPDLDLKNCRQFPFDFTQDHD